MRKFLFFLVLLPALAALGHDAYMFSKAPEKGFRISDIGALWDKYHKESHDDWKTKLNDISEVVGDFSISKQEPEAEKIQPSGDSSDYSGSFTQTDKQGKDSHVTPIKEQASVKTSKVQNVVGFILEQKALFVFTGLAVLIYLISALLGWLFREKTSTDKLDRFKKKNKKGEGYKYGRK